MEKSIVRMVRNMFFLQFEAAEPTAHKIVIPIYSGITTAIMATL